jgi:hypothetical protein
MLSSEKPAKRDANKQPQPRQRETEHDKVTQFAAEKEWRQVILYVVPVLIGVLIAIPSFIWSAHPFLSIWAIFAALSLTLFYVYYLMFQFVWRESHARKRLKKLCLIAEVMILILCAAWQYKAARQPAPIAQEKRLRSLTAQRRSQFVEVLKAQREPREQIRLGCVPSSEETCVFAGQLFDLFREAGWTVRGNKVERGTLEIPRPGVVLMRQGIGESNPSDPNSGLRMIQTPSLQSVERAFAGIGIKVEKAANALLEEDVTAVIVGLEP